MNRITSALILVASFGLLVLSFALLPIFEFDTPYSVPAAVPSTCAAAGGLLLAFLATRRLVGVLRLTACLLLLSSTFLFVVLLWHLRAGS